MSEHMTEYDQRGDIFGTSGAGAYPLASFLARKSAGLEGIFG